MPSQEPELWAEKADSLGPGYLEKWQQLLDSHGSAEALLLMGDEVEDLDPYEAYHWYRGSCEFGHADACMRLAWFLGDYYCSATYLESESWKERVRWYLRGRELGHSHYPICLTPFIKRELEPMLRRAQRGSSSARLMVGRHFASGNRLDHESAHAWLSLGLVEFPLDPDTPEWKRAGNPVERSRATLWFLSQILDEDELARAESIKDYLLTNYPCKMSFFWRTYYFFVRPL